MTASVPAAHGPGLDGAAQMAIDDFGGKVLGKPFERIFADYLNPVAVAGSLDRDSIAVKMRELPANGAFVRNGKVCADGLMQNDIYLLQLSSDRLHQTGDPHIP